MKSTVLNIFAMLFIIGSLVPLYLGFNHMFVYDSGEYGDSQNAYVGGDAYNFIINGTYATAFFVLFGALFTAGLIMYAISTFDKMRVAHVQVTLPSLSDLERNAVTLEENKESSNHENQ